MIATQTLEALKAEYLRFFNSQHLHPRTRANARQALAHFDAPDLSEQSIREWRDAWYRKAAETSTKNKYVGEIKSFVAWACLHGHASDPVDRLIACLSFERETHTQPKALERKELRALFTAIRDDPTPTALTVLLSYLVPARMNELLALKPENVDLDADTPHIMLFDPKTHRVRAMELSWVGVGLPLIERLHAGTFAPAYQQVAFTRLREAAGLPALTFKAARVVWSSYGKSARPDLAHRIDTILSHTAMVAAARYDDARCVGVTGDNAPAWFRAEDVIAEAVKATE